MWEKKNWLFCGTITVAGLFVGFSGASSTPDQCNCEVSDKCEYLNLKCENGGTFPLNYCRPVICPVQQKDAPWEPEQGAGYRTIRPLNDPNPGVGCQWLEKENNGTDAAQCRSGLYTAQRTEAAAFGWETYSWVDWSESCECPSEFIGTECAQVKSPQINGAQNCPYGKIYDGNILNPDREETRAECFMDFQLQVFGQYVEFKHHRMNTVIKFNQETRQVTGFDFDLMTRLIPRGAQSNPLLAYRCTNMNTISCSLTECSNTQVNGKTVIRCQESSCGGLETCDGCEDISTCRSFEGEVICPLFLLQQFLSNAASGVGSVALQVDELDHVSGELRGKILVFSDSVEIGITCRTGYCEDRPSSCSKDAKILCEDGCYYSEKCEYLGLDKNETVPLSLNWEVQSSVAIWTSTVWVIIASCFFATIKLSYDRRRWVARSIKARLEAAEGRDEDAVRSRSTTVSQSSGSITRDAVTTVPETAALETSALETSALESEGRSEQGGKARSDTMLESGIAAEMVPDDRRMGVLCDAAGYTLPLRGQLPSCCRKHKTILGPCTAFFKPGTLTAVIGPSGAGKSTLLDLLFGRPKKGAVKGKIRTAVQGDDGRWFAKPLDLQATAYIRQDDHLMATETVFECIWFAAQMRLPRRMPQSAKLAAVLELLVTLRIDHIADSVVGSADHGGISGGERRRVASAVELISKPSVIIADEPTSGLDSASAAILVEVLERQARRQATVVCSIHQPAPDLIRRFSHVLLLSKDGGVAYYGPAANMVPYLQTLPEYALVSPLPFEDPAPARPDREHRSGPEQRGSVARSTSQSLWSAGGAGVGDGLTAPVSNIADTAIELVSRLGPKEATRVHLYWVNTAAHCAIVDDVSKALANEGKEEKMSPVPLYDRPGAATQCVMLTERGFRAIVRRPAVMFFQLFVTGVVAAMVSITAGSLERDLQGAQTMIFMVLFFILFFSIMGMSSVGALVSDLHVFAREKQAKMYGALPYLVSKLICDFLPLRILPAIVFSAVSYWTMGLWPSVQIFSEYTITIILVSLISTLMCFCLSAIAETVALTNLMVSSILMWSFVFSGGLVLTEYGLLLRYSSYFFYAWEIIVANEYKQGVYLFNPEGVALLQGIERQGTDITLQLELDPKRIPLNFGLLSAWVGGLILITLFVLKCKRYAS